MTPQEAQGLAGYLLQHLDMERHITRKILAAMPEERVPGIYGGSADEPMDASASA